MKQFLSHFLAFNFLATSFSGAQILISGAHKYQKYHILENKTTNIMYALHSPLTCSILPLHTAASFQMNSKSKTIFSLTLLLSEEPFSSSYNQRYTLKCHNEYNQCVMLLRLLQNEIVQCQPMKLLYLCQKVVFWATGHRKSLNLEMSWFIYVLAISSTWGASQVHKESLFKKTLISSSVWPPSAHTSKVK